MCFLGGTASRQRWISTVGMIHSHPDRQDCWYLFPGTRVPGADGESFLRGPYGIDAILCGERLVWINREMKEREVVLLPMP